MSTASLLSEKERSLAHYNQKKSKKKLRYYESSRFPTGERKKRDWGYLRIRLTI